MKQKIISTFIISLVLILVGAISGCYKDKGNYTYRNVPSPVVTHLDSIYNVFVGDSLVVTPNINIAGVKDSDLSFIWTIQVPPVNPGDTNLVYTTRALRIIFGLGPQQYTVRLAVINKLDQMHYFYNFIINGKTAFSTGTTVLTDENGESQLSFIKPNDSVQARIFQAVNPGISLPTQPTQLLAIPVAYQPPIQSYWVFGKGGENRGINIDANSFKFSKTLSDNFFDAPDTTLNPEIIFMNPLGVITGIINGQLYNGTTSTWNQAPTYGMFGRPTQGDYQLSDQMVFDYTGTFGPGNYIGFDINRKQFLRFNLYGDATYFGTSYVVLGSDFDPTNIGMNLVHLQQINGGQCYAYFRRPSDDSLFELSFHTQFNGPFEFTTDGKRPFLKPELISSATKWQATQNGIIYFSYQDQIYRYNPTNQNFRTLTADFAGKPITMIKLMDQNTLIAGVDGSIYYLDISVGNFGTLIKRIDGLPGKVIDIAFRQQ